MASFIANRGTTLALIVLKTAKSSNKPQTPTEKPPTGSDTLSEVSVSAPFIDKISIVLDVPKGKQGSIVNAAMKGALKDKATFTDAGTLAKKGYSSATRIALSSLNDKKRFPLLQHRKIGHDACFVRLEFVPVDLGKLGLAQLIARLRLIFPDGWNTFLKHGRVTRIDVTVDVAGVRLDDFLLLPKQAITSLIYGVSGQAQTLYLGKLPGGQIKVYSRKKKRLLKNKQPWTGPSVVRVEKSINLGHQFKLAELGSLKNPFLAMTMVPNLPPCPNLKKAWEWSLFEDSVRQRGLVAALALLPPDRTKAYKKHLTAHKQPWWDPAAIWQSWSPVAAQLTLPKA